MGLRSVLITCALTTLATSAGAQPEPGRAPGEYFHNGLYVRIGLGGTFVRDSFESGEGNALFGKTSGSVTGAGTSHQFAIGGAIVPGFVLAGGVVSDIAWTTSVDADGEAVEPDDSFALLTLGPMIDYYFDPEAGFHALFGGGFGVTSGVQPEGSDGGAATGLGLFAGFGHEWWVSEQWGIGGLLRAQYVRAEEAVVLLLIDTYKVHHNALGLSLLFTATYN
jgi:hypothetical protein